MISADDIRSLRGNQIDAEDTIALKARIAHIRLNREPFYLTAGEFQSILEWKLGQQLGRGRKLRVANTDELIRAVTGFALTISHSDPDYEIELRIGALCLLRGVGVPVASAVLALAFPEKYAVIDFRAWRQCFGVDQTVFWVNDYKRYMREIQRLADELGWPPQEVDHAIWEYDRRKW